MTNKWIIAGAVWLAVLSLTYWNVTKIDSIVPARQQKEIYRMDELFWKYNSKNIAKIMKERARLFHPTESLKLGLISVENQLRLLAEKYEFTDFNVTRNPTSEEGSAPVSLSYKGSFKGTIQCLDTLEKDFPFMPVQRIVIATNPPERQAKFQMVLIYRYTIVPLES